MAWPEGVPPKQELREALTRAHPWLDHDAYGPRNVVAGDCDRCHAEARLVETCGPGGGSYGRRCATEDDWCEGHAAEAADALRWLHGLPDEADDVAYLWWLATGEIRYSERYAPLTKISASASGRGTLSPTTSPTIKVWSPPG